MTDVREEIVGACRVVSHFRIVEGFGHISARLGPSVLITPRKALGLVTSKSGTLESKDEIKRRIDSAAKFVDLEQLALSPQCGFSSGIGGQAMTVDEETAKLRLVVETAREVWGTA